MTQNATTIRFRPESLTAVTIAKKNLSKCNLSAFVSAFIIDLANVSKTNPDSLEELTTALNLNNNLGKESMVLKWLEIANEQTKKITE